MTPRPAFVIRLRLALFVLISSSLVQAAPPVSEIRKFETRKQAAAVLDLYKSYKPPTGSREERIYRELFEKPGKLGELYKAWEPGKGNADLLKLGEAELDAMSNGYRELQAAKGTRASLYEKFTGTANGKVGTIDLAAGLKSVTAEHKARVNANEAEVHRAVEGLDGKVSTTRIAELLGTEGAIRRSLERNTEAAYGSDQAALKTAIDGMVAMEVEAARLAGDMNEAKAKSTVPKDMEEVAAGKAVRAAMRMANGDPAVLTELGAITAKLNKPDNRDAMTGLGIMSRAMELGRTLTPTEAMYQGIARDILGGGVSEAVIKTEGERLRALESADFAGAKKYAEDQKFDTRGTKTAAELLSKVEAQLVKLQTTKPGETPNFAEIARLEQIRARVEPAAELEGSREIVSGANKSLTEGKISVSGKESMPELLAKVEEQIAKLEREDAALQALGKPPKGVKDLAILRELRDELHLRRMATMMRQNPRFRGMSKIQQFHTILCEAKAAGMRGPKVLVAAMAIVGLPVAAWQAIAKGKEPTEADFKGRSANRTELEQVAKTFPEQDVSKISLFGPASGTAMVGKPSVERSGNDPFAAPKPVHKEGVQAPK